MNKVQAELKRLHSPDVFDIDNANIAEGAPFSILVQAMFGPLGTEGEESFDVVVCNPAWLREATLELGPVNGRNHLIVSEFNADEIRTYLTTLADGCAGETWNEVAEKLSRYGKWEFEDYAG